MFQFNTPVAIGARGDGYGNSFLGLIDEVSVYARALSASEVHAVFNAGSAGKCNTPMPPFITTQPTNLSVTLGSAASFSVVAGGPLPLSYQWQFNGTNITAATTSSLTLANVQFTGAGNYSVTVSNPNGSVASTNAILTVLPPPSLIQAVNVSSAGGVAVVPIDMVAEGSENAVGFSISFDPTLLTFTGATLGSGATGGSLLFNTNQLGSGRLGLAVSLPANSTFTVGTQELAEVSFTTAPISQPASSAISFGDQPTLRQVSTPQATILDATYANGTVTIPFLGFEGDVSPRPNGDNIVSITDWVQLGRFAAGLDTISNATEFQRADCAPRSTLGDGLITVADWVQAGRYAVGLDPLTPAGGPTQAQGGGLARAGIAPHPLGSPVRTVVVANASAQAGQPSEISVQLNSQGDENALGFSLTFDPKALMFISASAGAGAKGATLNVNGNAAKTGLVGLALALPIGSAFAAGTQEVVQLHFIAAASASGNAAISFASQPVTQEVADATASTLAASYLNGALAIIPQNGSPVLRITQTGGRLALSWPASAAGFILEANTSLSASNWAGVPGVPVGDGTNVSIIIPVSGAQQYYRLRHP